jgi:hypothetical protein
VTRSFIFEVTSTLVIPIAIISLPPLNGLRALKT